MSAIQYLPKERRGIRGYARLMVVGCLCLALSLPTWHQVAAQEAGGYYYQVRAGESWGTIAKKVGLTTRQLQAANAHHMHGRRWLRTGHVLFIPLNYRGLTMLGTYTVKPGDSWTKVAGLFDISIELLWTANFLHLRSGLKLYKGEVLEIPYIPGHVPPIGVNSDELLNNLLTDQYRQ